MLSNIREVKEASEASEVSEAEEMASIENADRILRQEIRARQERLALVRRNGETVYYCRICCDHFLTEELQYWSGDDQAHWLCPGCGDDMVEPRSIDGEYQE